MKERNILLIGVSIFLLLVLIPVTGCSPAPNVIYQSPVSGQMGSETSAGGIIVSQQNLGLWADGLGKTTAVPDVVVLLLGVQSLEKSVAEAQKAASGAMNSVMQVLKAGGIADKDIKTTSFSIQQVTRWDDKQNKEIIIGYQVSNIVTIKIRDINKAGSVIDGAAAAGGDLIRVNGISFSVEDQGPLLKSARDLAIKDAAEKAKQMAQASGVKLGKLIYIIEGTVSTPVRDTYTKLNVMSAAPTPISAGELEFQVNVQLVYEID